MISIRQHFKSFLIFGLINLLLSCNGSDTRKAEYLEQGQQLYKSGDLKNAQAAFNKVIDIDPKNIQNRYQLAEILDNLGDVQSAVGQYQTILNQDAKQIQAQLKLGEIYLLAEKADAAEKMARDALGIEPENNDVKVLLGRVYAAQNNSDAAFVEAETVLQKKPDDVGATTLLASLYAKSGKLDKAVSLLQTNIDKNPQNVIPSLLLAELYKQTQAADKAEHLLESIVKIEPDKIEHRKRLAVFFITIGRLDDAEKVLHLAVNELPEDDQAKLLFVDFLASQRKPEVAMAELIPMIEQHPEAYDLRFKLADLQLAQNQADKVEETLKEAIEQGKNAVQTGRAKNKLARLYAATKRMTEAKTLVKDLLASNPSDIDARLLNAEFALSGNRLTDAIAEFRSILAEQPQNIKALKLLSSAHLLADDPVLARENIEKVVQLTPKDETARLDLVNLLLKTDASEQAMQQLDVLFKLNPNSKQGLEALFKIYLMQKQWPQAQQAAKQLEQTYSNDASGYYLSALAYQAEGKNDKSIDPLLHALDKQPQAVEPLTLLVKSYLALKQPEKAISKLDEIINHQSTNFIAYNLLGGVYFQANKLTEALAAYQKAIAVKPEWANSYLNIATIKKLQNRKADAVKILQDGINHAEDSLGLVSNLAAIYQQDGEHEKILPLYEEAYRKNPDSLAAINQLAAYLAEYAKDSASLERAAKLAEPLASSNYPDLLDTVAWITYKRADYAKAEQLLTKVVSANPTGTLSNYHLGMVYAKKGDKNHAKEYLEKALGKNKTFPGQAEAEAALKSIITAK